MHLKLMKGLHAVETKARDGPHSPARPHFHLRTGDHARRPAPVMNLRISVSFSRMTATSYAWSSAAGFARRAGSPRPGHVSGDKAYSSRRNRRCLQPPARSASGTETAGVQQRVDQPAIPLQSPYRSSSAQSVPRRRQQAPDDPPDTLPSPALNGVVQHQGELGDPPPTVGAAQAELVDPGRDHLDARAGVPRLHQIGPHLSGDGVRRRDTTLPKWCRALPVCAVCPSRMKASTAARPATGPSTPCPGIVKVQVVSSVRTASSSGTFSSSTAWA